jgi:hypothetical protein
LTSRLGKKHPERQTRTSELDISNNTFARAIRLFHVENFSVWSTWGCRLIAMSDYS